jgi:hypothetical protein
MFLVPGQSVQELLHLTATLFLSVLLFCLGADKF